MKKSFDAVNGFIGWFLTAIGSLMIIPFLWICLTFIAGVGELLIFCFSFGLYQPEIIFSMFLFTKNIMLSLWSENTIFYSVWIGIPIGLVFAKYDVLTKIKKIPIIGKILDA